MGRVAVFGNAGGGKSTLSRRLAAITGVPLHVIDIIMFKDGRYRDDEELGGQFSHEAYRDIHAGLLRWDAWIIDGFDSMALTWERFAAGLFRSPAGWPENSPLWESTWNGYRVIGRCHRHLTPKYRRLVGEMATTKRVHHLRSRREMRTFIMAVTDERGRHVTGSTAA